MKGIGKTERRKLLGYGAFLLVIVLLLLLFSRCSYRLPLFSGETGYRETGWYFGEKGGTLQPTALSDRHFFVPGKTYVLQTELTYDGEHAAYPCALVCSSDFEIRAFLDGEEQFAYTKAERGGPERLQSLGAANFTLSLGKHCAGRVLTLELGIPLRTGEQRRLPTVQMGDYAALMQNLFFASVPGLLLSAAITFVALVLVILGSPRREIRWAYIHFAVFALLVVLYRSVEDLYLLYVFGSPYYAFLCEYLALSAAAIPLMLSYRYAVKPHWDRVFRVLIGCLAGTLTVQLTLHFSGIRDMSRMLAVDHCCIAACILTILAAELAGRRKKLPADTFHKLIPIMAGVVLDILGYYRHTRLYGRGSFYYIGNFTGLGLLISLIMMVWDARKQRETACRESLRAQTLETMAYQDFLTGLYNRAAFNRALDQLPRDSTGVMIVACDLNGLKRVNDRLGHSAGDQLLRRTANLLRNTFGKRGQVFRTGGDEFFILFRDMTPEAWEELEAEFRKQQLLCNAGQSVTISLAMGASFLEDGDLDQCVQAADRQMYRNKCSSPDRRREES